MEHTLYLTINEIIQRLENIETLTKQNQERIEELIEIITEEEGTIQEEKEEEEKEEERTRIRKRETEE